MSISIMNIDPRATIISDPSARDGAQSSSADLYAKIVVGTATVTSSKVAGNLDFAVINGLKMHIWRHESGDISSSATNSSAMLGMDEIEFTLPCSDVDIAAVKAIADGEAVNITFRKTGSINSNSVTIEEFAFQSAKIVGTFFFIQAAVTPSITIRFKATQMQITRCAYDDSGKAKGQNVFLINLTSNTSK